MICLPEIKVLCFYFNFFHDCFGFILFLNFLWFIIWWVVARGFIHPWIAWLNPESRIKYIIYLIQQSSVSEVACGSGGRKFEPTLSMTYHYILRTRGWVLMNKFSLGMQPMHHKVHETFYSFPLWYLMFKIPLNNRSWSSHKKTFLWLHLILVHYIHKTTVGTTVKENCKVCSLTRGRGH